MDECGLKGCDCGPLDWSMISTSFAKHPNGKTYKVVLIGESGKFAMQMGAPQPMWILIPKIYDMKAKPLASKDLYTGKMGGGKTLDEAKKNLKAEVEWIEGEIRHGYLP